MLDFVDKILLCVKTTELYETPGVYHSNTTLYGGGGKLGMEKCEKSASRSNNGGNDCMYFEPHLTSADLPSQVTKNQYCLDVHAVRNLHSTFSRCEGTSQRGMETTLKLSQLA